MGVQMPGILLVEPNNDDDGAAQGPECERRANNAEEEVEMNCTKS